jgi:hypothetical protein
VNQIVEPQALPPEAAASALSVKALRRLFFRPTEYFQSVPLDRGHAWLFAAWISGISSVINRIDQRLLRSDLGSGRTSNVMAPIVDSWPAFWGFVLAFGVIWAAWNWWIGGWWYRVRLRWCGATDADPRQSRLVYTFASFVLCMPAVAYAVVLSAAYSSYRIAWESDPIWNLGLLVFIFWSVVTSWHGVLAVFPVRRAPALWWFAVLPACLYVALLGVLGALLTTVEDG